LRMMNAFRIARDLGADDAGRVGLLLGAADPADALATDHLDIEGTGRRAIVRTGGVADLDLGVLGHVRRRNTKKPASRARLSGGAHAIRSNPPPGQFQSPPDSAAPPHRKPPDIPGRLDFVRRRQSPCPAAKLPCNKNEIREVGMTAPRFVLALAAD